LSFDIFEYSFTMYYILAKQCVKFVWFVWC